MTATISISTARSDKPYPVPPDKLFKEEHVSFRHDEALSEISRTLIDNEPQFAHLTGFDIELIWKRQGGKSDGKPILGKAQKVSGVWRHLTNINGLVFLSADHIRDYGLSWHQVEAVVWHELCHFLLDKKGLLTLAPHDYEGFRSELERYGLWRSDLRRLGQTFAQIGLFEDESSN